MISSSKIVLLIVGLCVPIGPSGNASFAQQLIGTKSRTDRTNCAGPAEAVFIRNKIKCEKIETESVGSKVYDVFDVTLPYDPQSSETNSYFAELYVELFKATGQSDFALRDKEDGIRIHVSWNKLKKSLSVEYVPLR